MAEIIVTNRKTAILGMGVTGISVASFLSAKGMPFDFADSRLEPPNLKQVKRDYPSAKLALGSFDKDFLASYDRLIVSPGISLDEPALIHASKKGVELLGDLELFLDYAKAPVVMITGSNGKSTVTALLGQMAIDSGLSVGIGGNIGTPMLVLEASSFQLELLNDSRGAVSGLLNISPDHLDRYQDIQKYHAAKHRIFRGASKVVINREDRLTRPLISTQIPMTSFGLNQPDLGSFGVLEGIDEGYLSYGIERLMLIDQIALKGKHNIANVLAALALGYSVDLPMQTMLETVKTFKGLSHRCQTVAKINSVLYVNDSKAANKNLILIAGGQAKDQDFTDLKQTVSDYVKLLILIGEDADKLGSVLKDCCQQIKTDSLEEAVAQTHQLAKTGDIVLLSPACASFDMYSGFEERGRCFHNAVEAMASSQGECR
jgi:UDP-N-acetylmuramoylalanine--D-glutamate ligase